MPPPQPLAPVAPPRLLLETAAVRIQKVIRGFLLRKSLNILRKIEAEAEEIERRIARDEEILKRDRKTRVRVEDKLMGLVFQLNCVKGVKDYRRKVIKKIISLQKMINSIGATGCKNNSDPIEVERSDVVVDSDALNSKNPNPLKIEEKKVVEAVNPVEEAPVDGTDSISERGDDKMGKKIDSDSIEAERSDFVVDINQLVAQNPNFLQIEDYKVVAVSSMEEAPTDCKDSICVRGDDKIVEMFGSDPIEVQKRYDFMVDSDELTKQTPKFNQKEEVGSIEETPVEFTHSTKTLEMEELGKTSNADEEITEKAGSSNDLTVENMDELFDPIKSLELVEIVKKLRRHKLSTGQISESSQEMNNNETKEMEMKGVREVMEKMASDSERMKNLMEELHQRGAQQWQLMEGLMDWVQGLERAVERMERRDKRKKKCFGRRAESFS